MTHLTRSRPANLNPAAAITAYDIEVVSFSFGLHAACFGRDLPERVANARAYLARRRPLRDRLKRLLRA